MNVFNDHSRIDRVNNPDAPAKEAYQYAWGGFNDPRVYHSEDNVRLTSLIRKLHQRLAEQLMVEGKIDSAEKVLDHCNEVLPAYNFPYLLDHQLGYSQTCVFFIRDYFMLNTESGRQKGLQMALDYWNFFVEEMAWLDRNYDEGMADNYAELINYNLLFTQQMFNILNEYQAQLPEQELKKLKFDKFANAYIEKQNSTISRCLTDVEKNQEQLTMAFQSLKNITQVAQQAKNETIAQKGIQTAENQLNVFSQMDAGFGQSYRNFFYDKR